MKKIVRVLVAILLVCTLALTLTACKTECEKGNHNYVTDSTVPATCTEAGKTVLKCSECGESSEVTIPALGHDYTLVSATQGTCLDSVIKEHYKCNREGCQKLFVESNGIYTETTLADLGYTPDCDKSALVKVDAKAPTCATAGHGEHYSCPTCGQLWSADKASRVTADQLAVAIDPTAHSFGEWIDEIPATCNATGTLGHKDCSLCNKHFDEDGAVLTDLTIAVDETKHVEVVDPAVAVTCTVDGKTEGKHCSVCEKVLVAQQTIYAPGHHEVQIDPVPATCTQTGLTAGKKCDACNTVTVEPTVIDALGHTYGTEIALVPATCTTAGTKAHYECSVCDKLFVKEGENYVEKSATDLVIAQLAHTEVEIPAVPATCTTAGSTAGKKCSVCDVVITAPTVVEKIAHTEVDLAAKSATCAETGLTAGKKCSVCGTITVAQTVVEKLPHTEVDLEAKAATCTEKGLTAGKKCSVCGTITDAQLESPALGHTEVDLAAKPATCTETGLQAGKKCSVCGTVTVAQAEIPALGHKWSTDWSKDSATHWHACTNTGCTAKNEEVAHSNATATDCTVEVACDVCEQSFRANHSVDLDTKVDAKAPTCTEDGNPEYYSCANCDSKVNAQGQTVNPVISKLNHDFAGQPVSYTWADDNATATAERSCKRDGCTAKDTETVNATSVVTPATCGADGYTTFTATFTSEAFEAQTKVVTANGTALEHDYTGQTVSYAWANDNSAITAEVTCKNCNVHKVTQQGTVASAVTDPVCEVDGYTTYTATFTNPLFATQTKVITAEGSALTHDYQVVENSAVPATCTTDGHQNNTQCSLCYDVITGETISATGHTYGELIAKVNATCQATGFEAHYRCTVCDAYFASDIDLEDKFATATTETALTIAINADAHKLDKVDHVDGYHKTSCTNEGCEHSVTDSELFATKAVKIDDTNHKIVCSTHEDYIVTETQAHEQISTGNALENLYCACGHFYKPTNPETIVNATYELASGATLEGGNYTLTGLITKIDTAYSDENNNITVTIQVGDLSNKQITCYRMTGNGIDSIKVGDTITVTGELKNYYGTREFNTGCTLDSVTVAKGTLTFEVIDYTDNTQAGSATITNEATETVSAPVELDNGTVYKFKVTPTNSCQLYQVKLGEDILTADDGWYSVTILSATKVTIITAGEDVKLPKTVQIVMSEQGWTNAQAIAKDGNIYGDTVISIVNNGGGNCTYYDSGSALRCYGGNKFTVSAIAGYKIHSITIVYTKDKAANVITASVGTFENDVWTGESNDIQFTIGGASGHCKISKITIVYKEFVCPHSELKTNVAVEKTCTSYAIVEHKECKVCGQLFDKAGTTKITADDIYDVQGGKNNHTVTDQYDKSYQGHKGICDVCGTEGEIENHNWVVTSEEGAEQVTYGCSVCGMTRHTVAITLTSCENATLTPVEQGITLTVEQPYNILLNKDFAFQVVANTNYEVRQVLVNGAEVVASGGIYTINNITSATTITVITGEVGSTEQVISWSVPTGNTDGTQVTGVYADGVITKDGVTLTFTNDSKFYNGNVIRFYKDATLKVAVDSSKVIKSIQINLSGNNVGTLVVKNEGYVSGTYENSIYTWNGYYQEVTFTTGSVAYITSIVITIDNKCAHTDHANAELITGTPSTCKDAGTADHKVCPDCGQNLDSTGKYLPTLILPLSEEHSYDNGKCSICDKTDTSTESWVLVTNINQLSAGAEIVIVANESAFALSTTQNTNNRGQIEVKKGDGTVEINDNVQKFTLAVEGEYFLLKVSDTSYLGTRGSSNGAKTYTNLDGKSKWTITVTEAGIATLKTSEGTKNILRYNATSSCFACYSDGQKDISIYVKTAQ